MNIKAVLFDLDGTLLPMDQATFIKAYFAGLAAKLAPYGYTDTKALFDALWAGTSAMVKNEGKKANEEVFWDVFANLLGEGIREYEPLLDSFYRNEFQAVKNACGFSEDARKLIDYLKGEGYRLILATNPIFPAVATESRIRWAGLEPSDFELYTTYENSKHAKPNTTYYEDILASLALNPEECLMVGNDVKEDMVAEKLGMKVFLVTDCIINSEGIDVEKYPKGTLSDVIQFVKNGFK